MISQQEPLFTGPPPQTIAEVQIEQKPNDNEEDLVVATKVSSRVKGFNLKKIFQEVNKQQPSTIITPPPILSGQESLKRDMSLKQKVSITEKQKQKQKEKKKNDGGFGKITEDAVNSANVLLDIYKFGVTNRFMCDVAEKARSQFKQKLALYLFYGIEQLKISDLKLNDFEQTIIQKETKQQVEYIKRLVNQIELYLIRHHNKLQKNKIQRGYKDRANLILVNMKDEANTEIRNKVLNNKITPEMLSTVRQIDLYTASKREQMIAKSRRFMAQNTLQVRNQDQEHEIEIETIKQQKQHKLIQEPKPKYVDDKISTELIDLISKHIEGFYNKLKNDLPTQQAQFLCSHLDLIFARR